MSKISKEDVEHTSALARLELTETEEAKITQDLGEILDYVDELKSAETSDTKPISQISDLANIARVDEVTNGNVSQELLQNAPETKDGLILVKKVFE